MVVQTNKFALECIGGERFFQWSQVTVFELQAYIGSMVMMGIVHLPSIYDYWKKDEVFHYSPVASWISRDHFFELHRYLHFADNSTLPQPCIQLREITAYNKQTWGVIFCYLLPFKNPIN